MSETHLPPQSAPDPEREVSAEALWLGACTAAILLTPYATVFLQYRSSLFVQAVAILFFVLLIAVPPLTWGRRRDVGALVSGATSAGFLLYIVASLLGGLIAVIRGNDPTFLAGQLLSMGLLPLAGLGGLLYADRGRVAAAFRRAVVWAAGLAAAVHTLHWVHSLSGREVLLRFYLPNQVSLVGASLLAIFLALASALLGRRTVRGWLYLLLCAFLVFFAIGSGVRSLWLAGAVSAGIFVLLRPPARPWRLLVLVIAAALALVTLGIGIEHTLSRRPSRVSPADLQSRWGVPPQRSSAAGDRGPGAGDRSALLWRCEESGTLYLEHPMRSGDEGVFRVAADLKGPPRGGGSVLLQWRDARGEPLPSFAAEMETDARWQIFEVIDRKPAGATSARLEVRCTPGMWRIRSLSFNLVHSNRKIGLLIRHGHYLNERLATLGEFLRSPLAEKDRSIAERFGESRFLLSEVASGSWTEVIFGRGLGATYRFPMSAPGESSSEWVVYPEPNFIHNFYVFLLYKLGILGTALVLAAIGLWLGGLYRTTRAVRDPDCHLWRAAAAACFTGYVLWSAASPQILDFRIAPLIGLLLAMSAPERAASPGTR